LFGRRWVPVLVVPVLLLAGCSSDGPTPSAGSPGSSTATRPTCQPRGSQLDVTANNLLFDSDCYAVPAGTPFTITLTNDDEASHNFSLYETNGMTISRGPVVEPHMSGPRKFESLPSGTYVFRCDIHSAMTGDFLVA
jgi:plastocyanin